MCKSPAQLYLLFTASAFSPCVRAVRLDHHSPFPPAQSPLSRLTQEAEPFSSGNTSRPSHALPVLCYNPPLHSRFHLVIPPLASIPGFHAYGNSSKTQIIGFVKKQRQDNQNKKKKMVWACVTYTRTCNYYSHSASQTAPNKQPYVSIHRRTLYVYIL